MKHNKPKLLMKCFLCAAILLALGGCRDQGAALPDASGNTDNYSADITSDSPQNSGGGTYDDLQSADGASPSSQNENSSSQDEPTPEGSTLKGGIIRSTFADTGEYPNEIVQGGHGTADELDRFRKLLITELDTLDAYIFNEEWYDKKMTDEQAAAIVDYYINTEIGIIPEDEFPNPYTGGSGYVKGYDKDGNFLFEATDNGLLMVRFADGMMYDFYFDDGSNFLNFLY